MARSYGQYCGIARALDVVGDRWALLLVRELLYLGPRRFRDLRAALPGLAPNLLTRRLRELEKAGVVARDRLPDPARVPVYRLTRRGRGLEPVLHAMLQWGRPLLGDPRGRDDLRVALTVMALRALSRPEDAAGVEAVFEFRIEGQVFQALVAERHMELLVGSQHPPDVVATAEAVVLADVAAGRADALEALSAGTLRLEGEPDALAHFVRIFGHNPELRLRA
jgi:DNA-binding HxlR family transcriptional regulator